jgi:hypothetical protein
MDLWNLATTGNVLATASNSVEVYIYALGYST